MGHRPRILIIDDDATFGAILAATARKNGLEAEAHASLVELGSFARLREFDLAVVDYFLESLRGDEVAQYADTFFAGLPVIVVSAKAFSPDETAKWPASVKQVLAKERGPQAVIDAALGVLGVTPESLRAGATADPARAGATARDEGAGPTSKPAGQTDAQAPESGPRTSHL